MEQRLVVKIYSLNTYALDGRDSFRVCSAVRRSERTLRMMVDRTRRTTRLVGISWMVGIFDEEYAVTLSVALLWCGDVCLTVAL